MKKIFSILAAVLFAGSMMADNFAVVSSVSDLANGDQIIITGADTLAAISTTQNKNNRGVAEVSATDGVVVPGADVQIITLVADGGNFMLQVGEDAYLYAASNSSNHLKTANAATVGDNGKFAITMDANGVASVVAQGSNARNDLRYNPGSSCFACYASTTSVEAGLRILKKQTGDVPPTPSVATPVITGDAEFAESTTVTITCATEGANIYYTIDGTDPLADGAVTTVYGEPFNITATTTVKAYADDNQGHVSTVATKTFTKKEPLAAISCADVYSKAKGDEIKLNNVVVTYANNKNVYVQDATGSMLLYLTKNATWEAGNILSGIEGTLDIYYGLYEVKMTDAQVTAVQPGQGEAPAPVEFNAAPVAADMNKYIVLKNVTVSAEAFPSNKNMNCTIGEETFVLRNNFNANVAFDTSKKYDITGAVAVYNSTVQVYFISAEEVDDTPLGAPSYYVAGSMNSWTANPAYKLTANPNAEGEYMGEFTFAANDEFKVIMDNGSETYTWYPDGVDNNYVITEAGDYAVYFRPAGNVEGWYEGFFYVEKAEPVMPDTLSCAQAREAALSGMTDEVIVRGYVTEIVEAWSSFKNVSFWMADTQDGGKVFEAFRVACENEADAPGVGDLVWVKGNLTKYQSTPEIAAGGTFGIIEKSQIVPQNLGKKTIAEFLALKNTMDTCILTGVVDSIANTTYGNLYLSDATGQVYVYGVLTADGQSKKFAELGVEVGDELTVLALYNEYQGKPQVKNAIFVSVKKNPTAISNTAVEGKAVKALVNGQVLIIKNGKTYNVLGTRVR